MEAKNKLPGTIVSGRGSIDEAILHRRLRIMQRGEVCYLFPESLEQLPRKVGLPAALDFALKARPRALIIA